MFREHRIKSQKQRRCAGCLQNHRLPAKQNRNTAAHVLQKIHDLQNASCTGRGHRLDKQDGIRYNQSVAGMFLSNNSIDFIAILWYNKM